MERLPIWLTSLIFLLIAYVYSTVAESAPTVFTPYVMTNNTPITPSQMTTNLTTLSNMVNNVTLNSFLPITDYGAVANQSSDTSTALNAALSGLSTYGGNFVIPVGGWVTNSAVSLSNKNAVFYLDPNATYAGTTPFPRTLSEPAIQPIAVHGIFSPTLIPPVGGGYAGIAYSYTQSSGQIGKNSTEHLSATLGSASCTNASCGVAALTAVDTSNINSTGSLYGINVKHNTNSASTSDDAGINILGGGNIDGKSALTISRDNAYATKFTNGISISGSRTAITDTLSSTDNGVIINNLSSNPTGYALKINSSANAVELAIGANGQLAIGVNAIADSTGSGALVLGNNINGTPGVTANPAKWLKIFVGSAAYYIPLYQ